MSSYCSGLQSILETSNQKLGHILTNVLWRWTYMILLDLVHHLVHYCLESGCWFEFLIWNFFIIKLYNNVHHSWKLTGEHTRVSQFRQIGVPFQSLFLMLLKTDLNRVIRKVTLSSLCFRASFHPLNPLFQWYHQNKYILPLSVVSAK